MKNILLIAVLSMSAFSCEMLDAVKSVNSMPNQMNGMNNNMTDMKDKMAELEMNRDMDNLETYIALSPVPYKVLGPAAKFGESAPVMDLIKWFYTRRQLVESTKASDNVIFSGVDANGNPKMTEADYEIMKVKYANALSAVAGLAPQNKVIELVSILENEYEYSATVAEFLTIRYNFLTKTMLENKYNVKVLQSIGEMEAAVDYLKKAEYIAQLPLADKLYVETTSFDIFPDFNKDLTYGVDKTLINKYWIKLNDAFEKNLKIGSYAANEDQKVAQRQRMLSVKSEIDQGLARSQQYVAPVAP